jgi:threonine 3-dehydrogenase
MRIFVTGAGGQIGSDLLVALREQGHDAHGSDLGERPARLSSDIPWHRVDVTDAEAVASVLGELKPERVYHLAAILSARGEQIPQTTYAVNQGGTYNVLEACRIHGIGQVIFTSTIAVFGPGLPDLVPDDASLRPTTMYGVTKVAGELLGEYYGRKFGIDFRGVRFPGLIGPTLPGGGTSDYALFMYVDGVRHGKYEAFCRADTRIPLMYMPDGIRALVELADAPRERLRRSIYNIAAFSPTAQQIADSVARAIPGVRITFAPDPRRQAILDSWPRALDDSNAHADWGWKASCDLDGMTDALVPDVKRLLHQIEQQPQH